MDHAAQLALVEELALSLHEEVKRQATVLSEIQPALTREFTAFVAGRVAQTAADHRKEDKDAREEQHASLRVELHKLAEEKMALLWQRENGAIEEIRKNLYSFAAELIGQKITELSATHGTQLSTLTTQLREFAEQRPLQSAPGDPAGQMVPTTVDFVSLWAGQWTPKLVLRRNQFVSFRGSVYLVLRDVRGVVPTKQNQQGANAAYALFTPCGAPGLPGKDAQGVQLTTFPASASAAGITGQLAYSNGYAAFCVATNTWVFWPTSSDYPF